MRSLRAKLMLFWVVCAALLLAATNLIAFRRALDAQFQQLRHTLMAVAATAVLPIDGDAHAQIPPDPASTRLPRYQALVAQLQAIQRANPTIRYVYTMAPSHVPGQWYYVGDASTEDPDFSYPGEPYEASRYPAMMAGLEGPSADPAMTFDEWGALLSGYAPIRTRAGEAVGIIGIDMSGEQVLRTQAMLRRWQIVTLALGLSAVVLFGVLMAHWISKPIQILVHGTQRIGAGDLNYRVPVRSQDEVGCLAQSFNQMAELLSNSMKQLQEHVLSTIESLSQALEAKDHYTRGHSERVRHYAVKIAKQMRLPLEQVDLINEIANLHDVGKIGIREEILNKPTKLTPDEFDEIKRHPQVGYKILAPLQLPEAALAIVRHHHERQDGNGYPAGLREEQIPLPVAVVTVADAFDAMTGHRPYRQQPLSFTEAVAELQRCSETQFRRDAVDALVQVLQAEGKLNTPVSEAGSA